MNTQEEGPGCCILYLSKGAKRRGKPFPATLSDWLYEFIHLSIPNARAHVQTERKEKMGGPALQTRKWLGGEMLKKAFDHEKKKKTTREPALKGAEKFKNPGK